jgi:hypothetical protein
MSYDDDDDVEMAEMEQKDDDSFEGNYAEREEMNNIDAHQKFNRGDIEGEIEKAIHKRREERKQAEIAGERALNDFVDEHLGDDFEDTPWVPPSLEVVRSLLFSCYSLTNTSRLGNIIYLTYIAPEKLKLPK